MDKERIAPHRTVLVDDGAIAAIGPAPSVHIPKPAQRIDGRSKFLMPGLAEMHVHLKSLTFGELNSLFLANGITTVLSTTGPIAARRVPGRK